MKKVLLLILCVSFNVSFAGDGTLPVVRNVQIEFLNSGQGLNIGLPDCVRVDFNSSLKRNKSISKKIKLKNVNLVQILNLKNNGDLIVNLDSAKLKSNTPLNSIRKDLNQSEFMNELSFNDQIILQHISLNSRDSGKYCLKR